MDHFLNPRNMGDVESADGVGEVGAAACGDIMKISLKIRDGKIEDARFKTFGCGSAIASSSMATELIKGRTLEEAKNFSNQEVVDALGGLPPREDSLFGSGRGSAQGPRSRTTRPSRPRFPLRPPRNATPTPQKGPPRAALFRFGLLSRAG